jgi:hypothetical protein
MNQCGDCLKAPNGNCGKHLESYLGAVSHSGAAVEAPKTVQQLIQEAVDKATLLEKGKWMEIMGAWKQGTPKNHIPCGCKKCQALGQALQKAPVYS